MLFLFFIIYMCWFDFFFFFFFNDTATTEIYTLSLHDALPICPEGCSRPRTCARWTEGAGCRCVGRDRKSTRLNSSHSQISYAVFCLKKKKKKTQGKAHKERIPKASQALSTVHSAHRYDQLPTQ